MDLMEARRGLLMSSGLSSPSNVFYTEIVPETNTRWLVVDTGFTLLNENRSAVFGIITNDISRGDTSINTMSIIEASGICANYGSTVRFNIVRKGGISDWLIGNKVSMSDGVLTVNFEYNALISGCRYKVVVMI